MTEEETGATETTEEQVETTESEQVQETPPTDLLEGLKSELEKTRQDLEKAQREAKAHQRNVSKKDSEIQAQKRVQESLSTRMDLLTEMMADEIDRSESSEFGEKTTERKSDAYRQRMADAKKAEQDALTSSQEATIRAYASEIVNLTSPKGVEFNKDPKLQGAYIKWLEGEYEGAVEEARSVMSDQTEVNEEETKQPTMEEQFERWYQDRRRKEMIKSGELDAETGQPKAGNLADEEFLAKFSSGDLPATKENVERAQKIISS